MTIACYCRVSTRQQKNDSQESEIRKWLAGNGIDPDTVEWYRDHETGKTLRRPEFDRLQQDIFHGRIKWVVVWKLDRLSRRLRDGVTPLSIVQRLDANRMFVAARNNPTISRTQFQSRLRTPHRVQLSNSSRNRAVAICNGVALKVG